MSSLSIPAAMATGIYPERQEPRLEWLDRMAATATGMLAPLASTEGISFRLDCRSRQSPESIDRKPD